MVANDAAVAVSSLQALHPIARTTATQAVAEQLIGLINSGRLKPGDRLPPERELARQLDVGRTTVREALKLLTLSGLLDARRGSGTFLSENYGNFVASFVVNRMQWPALLGPGDVDHVFEVREALEVQAARLAAERATDAEIERIAVYREMANLAGRDVARETEIDLAFHEALASASHNPLLFRLMSSLQSVLCQYIALSNSMTHEPNMASTMQEHAAIFEAITARDKDGAARAMRAHLAIGREWIVAAAQKNREMGK